MDNIIDRFEKFIDKSGECWLWTGCKRKGYGAFRANGETVAAHRFMYELVYGSIPNNLFVRHKCRGKCVNPEHLELGTQQDNEKDKIRDGTILRGERHHHHKLTNSQVLELRNSTKSSYQLAKEYSVCPSTIQYIKSGRTWK